MLQQHEEVEKIQQDEIAAVERALQEKMSPMLECKAQPCPDLLRRGNKSYLNWCVFISPYKIQWMKQPLAVRTKYLLTNIYNVSVIFSELAGLFVSMNLSEGPLTVITFCQRTVNDMTAWSSEVEEERDELVENVSFYSFVTSVRWYSLTQV